jgi:hypothetical protein
MSMNQGPRAIFLIAREIKADWRNPYFGAKPYIEAMHFLRDITDFYHEDSARSVLRYFLSNCGTWRGPVARRIKAELKELLK